MKHLHYKAKLSQPQIKIGLNFESFMGKTGHARAAITLVSTGLVCLLVFVYSPLTVCVRVINCEKYIVFRKYTIGRKYITHIYFSYIKIFRPETVSQHDGDGLAHERCTLNVTIAVHLYNHIVLVFYNNPIRKLQTADKVT